MNFKYYDLLSHLIPGFLVFVTVSYLFKDRIPEVSVTMSLVIAYIIGFFNNTFSSWLEGFYRFLWGGDPINHFFDKKGIWKVKYYNGSKIKELLIEKFKLTVTSNSALFLEVKRIANENTTERLEDFNAKYAFARSLLTSIIISGIFVTCFYYSNITVDVTVLFLIVVALIRCYQRSGYYIREALDITLNVLSK